MTPLPDRGWSYYEGALRRLGERRPDSKDGRAADTLAELQLITEDMNSLTDLGQRISMPHSFAANQTKPSRYLAMR